MEGMFTNSEVVVSIYTTAASKLVHTISVVYFPKESDKSDFWGRYDNLKVRLTQKYGKPVKEYEHFEFPYSRKQSPDYAIVHDYGKVCTTFETENGLIELTFLPVLGNACTAIVYIDKINSAINDAELNDEL